MNIVFMGTPGFAAAALRRLYEDGRNISAVFTQPDKPRSRGMKVTPSPVKELAAQYGTPVYQPVTLRDGEVLGQLAALHPDVIAVVAYGKLLPNEILTLPTYGCINIHGSLLPKYRGAAPVQWAVLNGEKTTGVTSMYLAEAMDAGDMIFKKETEIGGEETYGELYDRLSALGAALLSETLDAIGNGTAPRIKQNDALATYAPPLGKEITPINWEKSTREILCHIRGLNPKPVATADIGGVSFKIYKAVAGTTLSNRDPGTIINADNGGIEVACGDGTVVIKELQAPGGKRMAASDYLRGHPMPQHLMPQHLNQEHDICQ